MYEFIARRQRRLLGLLRHGVVVVQCGRYLDTWMFGDVEMAIGVEMRQSDGQIVK